MTIDCFQVRETVSFRVATRSLDYLNRIDTKFEKYNDTIVACCLTKDALNLVILVTSAKYNI